MADGRDAWRRAVLGGWGLWQAAVSGPPSVVHGLVSGVWRPAVEGGRRAPHDQQPTMGDVVSSMKPRMRQILSGNGKGGTTLRSERLQEILLDDGIINKPVIVISVTGAARTGKSLLTGLMIRHLCRESPDSPAPPPLDLSHTTGILMWSRPFPVTLPTGEEAAIVLMDTQGAPEDESAEYQAHAEFTLGTLLSSLQIFNVMGDVRDADLERLEPFVEYGRTVLDKTATSPLQRLLFVVRDWKKVDQFSLGEDGGNRLVTKRLLSQGGEALNEVRTHIGDCYSDIDGFLLPHPGEQVASTSDFNGDSDQMDSEFVAELEKLMSKVLAPENLAIKTIAGNPLTAGDLFTLFTSYVKLFPNDEVPTQQDIMQATAEASHIIAAKKVRSQYEEEMKGLLSDDHASADQETLIRKHREAATRAEKSFNNRKKIGDETMSQKHLQKLLKEIEEWFEKASEESRKKANVDYIIALIDTCTKMYVDAMKPIADSAGFVAKKDMDRAHHLAKEKAINTFDARIRNHSVEWDSRFKLAQIIGTHFRLLRHHNDVKKDAASRGAAGACLRAVQLAHKCYHTVMAGSASDGALTGEGLQQQHQKALQVAIATFEPLREGPEQIAAAYQDGLKKLIDEELEVKMHSLPSD